MFAWAKYIFHRISEFSKFDIHLIIVKVSLALEVKDDDSDNTPQDITVKVNFYSKFNYE